MPLVTSGVEHGNLRELALARMKDFGTECRDVRTREVGIQEIHNKVRFIYFLAEVLGVASRILEILEKNFELKKWSFEEKKSNYSWPIYYMDLVIMTAC